VEKIANELHIDFTLEHNELLKGVSRVRSLDIILEIGKVEASQEDKNKWLFQKMKNTYVFSGYGSKRTITWRFINAALLKRKPTDCFGISQQKCKTYSGENGNQTLF
jgi:hypothetical protein